MWLWPSDQITGGTVPLRGEPGGGERRDLALAERGVALGDGEDQRHLAVNQPGQRADLGGRPVAEVAELGLAALADVRDLVEAGQQACAPDAVERACPLPGQVGGDVHAAGRVARHHDPRRVAAVGGDVVADPLDGGGDVLRAGRPGVPGGEAVGDRHADPAVADRPRADVVVHRGACHVLVAADEAATVHEQEDRGARLVTGGVHVESLPFVIAVGEVAVDLRRGVADLVVERLEQCPARRHQFRRDRRAHRGELRDHVGRKLLRHSCGTFRSLLAEVRLVEASCQ